MLTTEIDRICDKFNSEIERLNLELDRLDRLDIVAPSPESEKEYNAYRFRREKILAELMTYQKSILIVLSVINEMK